jgi:hypothetical protein
MGRSQNDRIGAGSADFGPTRGPREAIYKQGSWSEIGASLRSPGRANISLGCPLDWLVLCRSSVWRAPEP